MKYQPKRSTARWLEGAPKPVLACYDSGPNKGADRYLVLYGTPLWDEGYGRDVPARAMSEHPSSAQGIGLYVQVPAWNRSAFGRKVKFSDLPPDCQRLVAWDCEETAEA